MTDLFILPVPASMTRAATVKKARATLGREFSVDVVSGKIVVASKHNLDSFERRCDESRATKLLDAVGLMPPAPSGAPVPPNGG